MSEKICPECRSPNPMSETMCDQCGCPLEEHLPTTESSQNGSVSDDETCSNCGASVTKDANYCDSCGFDLTQASSSKEEQEEADTSEPQQVEEPSAPEPPPLMGSPKEEGSDQAENPDTDLPEPEPGQNVDSEADTAPLVQVAGAPRWKLTTVEGFRVGKEYLLYREQMLIGRIDPDGDVFPDLDLEDQDDGYVSRRHAKLLITSDQVMVVDLGGENGTFLENKPIPPHKPMPFRAGQVLKVGKVGLMLQVYKNNH